MIQRIQSFYLVLAVIAIVIMFKFPIATYTIHNYAGGGDVVSELGLLRKDSRYSSDSKDSAELVYIGQDIARLGGGWVLAVNAALIGVIALISIFLFKNRILQMRTVAFAFLFNIVYIFLIFFWAINGTGGSGGYLAVLQNFHFTEEAIDVSMLTPGTIAPIVSAVLLFLAQRAIKKDEIKVRAADRLR